MGKIVAIGGVNPPTSLDLIDKEIIKLTNKKYPKTLYVPGWFKKIIKLYSSQKY